jgi:hypothetical protein
MEPIDRPFRFSRDFCVAWALLAVPMFILVLTGRWDFGPWYSDAAFIIIGPFFATFFIYGPVLLMRQVIRSGSHGWFIFRVFTSIVLVATLLLVGLYFSGYYTEWRARLLAGVFTVAATVYLSWRMERS